MRAKWWKHKPDLQFIRQQLEAYQNLEAYQVQLANLIWQAADDLTRELTAFSGIDAMLDAQRNNYRPSLSRKSPEVQLLADLYDEIASRRGLKLRAYRG